MAVRRVQLRRGTTAENNGFTGAVGEVTVDTQTNSIRVHDGATAGGQDLMRNDMSNNSDVVGNINFTNDDHTIGGDIDGSTLTLGQVNSIISIPGTLNVNIQNTTQDLAVQDRAIILASGNEGNDHTDGDSGAILSLGLIFTRTLSAGGGAQDEAVFFWDEASDRFKLGVNAVDGDSTEWNTGLTTAGLLLGSLDVDDGNITNVADISLDTISADGNTIGMTLKQAGGATAFTIIDDDQAGTGVATFLTIDATDGTDSVTIDATSFVVNSTISLDNTVVINEAGADKDFRVEGDTDTHLLFTDASTDRVGISESAPDTTLHVSGDTTLDGNVFINAVAGNNDFNVSASNALNPGVPNALFVDASTGRVGINTAAPSFRLEVLGTSFISDVARFNSDLDLTTNVANGITFNKGVANDTTDADLLRVDRSGSFSTLAWDSTNSRFVLDTNLQISSGGVELGDGSAHTTISVPDDTAGGAGWDITIASGQGNLLNGTNDGSVRFDAGSNADVLVLDTSKLATFSGNIDFSADEARTIGASIGAGTTLTLGGNATSIVATAGDLKVTGNTIKSSTDADAIELSGANVDVLGTLEVSGNEIKQSDASTVITFSGDVNKTATFAGNISVTNGISMGDDLTVEGGDLTLGDGTNATSIKAADQTAINTVGEILTISAGVGNGTGTGGELRLQTGGANGAAASQALVLEADKDAIFYGDIDFSADEARTIGASIGAATTLTLGGNATSVIETAGNLLITGNTATFGNGATIVNTDANTLTITEALVALSGNLRVGTDVIQDSTGQSTITLSGDNATLAGDLTISGNDLDFSDSNVNIGASVATAGRIISIGGAATTITRTVGHLRVGSNIIQASDGGTTITLDVNDNVTIGNNLTVSGTGGITLDEGATLVNTDANTLTITEQDVVLSGDLTVGGNTIKSSGGTDAIELLGSVVSTKGVLNVEGTTVTLSTDAGGDATIKPFTRTTLNANANDLILQGGSSDGTGVGGSIIFKTQPTNVAGVGSQEGNQTTALTILPDNSAEFAGNVTVQNLTVNGTTTTVNSETLTITDSVIVLNKDANEEGVALDRDSGIFMERRGLDASLIYWDEGLDRFIFATTTANGDAVAFEGTTTLQTIRSKSLELDGGSLVIDSANNDFVIDQNGVITSTNTASFDVDSATALVVQETGGANNGVVFAVDTNTGVGAVKTKSVLPLADNTHNIGANGNVFATGYFTDLQIATATSTGTLTFEGGLNVETSATNGITFRSEAEAEARADATLLRVREGNNSGTFSSLNWDESYDGFSFSSKTNSVGDFGVGVVGAETFYVTAPTGDVNIEGDITTGTNENKTIFAGVTSNTITLGGGGTSIVEISNDLKVTGNTIKSSGDQDTITLSGADVSILGDLTVTGDTLTFGTNGATIENTDADTLTISEVNLVVSGAGDLTVEGANIKLGTDANATPTFVEPVHRVGDNLDGNSLTIKGGRSTGTGDGGDLIFETYISGVAGNGQNNSQTIMTLNTEGEVVLGTDGGGQEIIRAETSTGGAGNALVIASGLGSNAGVNDGSLILRSGSTTVLTLDTDELATFAGNVQITGDASIATTKSLTLNSGVANAAEDVDAQIIVDRGTDTNVAIRWDEGDNRWMHTNDGTNYYNILNSNDTLVQFAVDAVGSANIFIEQGDGTTVTFNGNSGANNSGLEFSTNGNAINLAFESTVRMPGDLSLVAGGAQGSIECHNLTVNNDAILNGAKVKLKDNILFIGLGNTSNANDLGFYARYADSDNGDADRFAGLTYDVSENVWKLFDQETTANLNVNGEALTISPTDAMLASIDLSSLTAVSSINVKSPTDNSSAKTAILLNSDQAGNPAITEDVSIEVERGDDTNATLTWDEGDDRWTLDNGEGSTNAIVTTKASEGARYECTSPAFAGNAITLTAPDAVENKHAYFLSNGATAGTVNLFDLTTGYDGYVLQIFNTGTNTLTVDGSGGQQVDGADTKDVVQGASLTLMAFGTDWFVV